MAIARFFEDLSDTVLDKIKSEHRAKKFNKHGFTPTQMKVLAQLPCTLQQAQEYLASKGLGPEELKAMVWPEK